MLTHTHTHNHTHTAAISKAGRCVFNGCFVGAVGRCRNRSPGKNSSAGCELASSSVPASHSLASAENQPRAPAGAPRPDPARAPRPDPARSPRPRPGPQLANSFHSSDATCLSRYLNGLCQAVDGEVVLVSTVSAADRTLT